MPSIIEGNDNFQTSAGGIVLQTRYKVFDQWTDYALQTDVVHKMDFLAVNIVPKSVNSVFKLELSLCFESGIVTPNIMFSATRNDFYIQNPLTLSAQNSGIAAFNQSLSNNIDSTMDMAFYSYVDAPQTTEPITYSPTMRAQDNFNLGINRTWRNANLKHYETGISTFIVTELSGD